ncbi:recombination protein RecR [Patescibacteria group bacterium]|nr:recombination protein RecR [Patescibacteria group bacterium]
MRPQIIEKLVHIFTQFPGIGPRQAARFAYYLVSAKAEIKIELKDALEGLKRVKRCGLCDRVHEGYGQTCALCSDSARDRQMLAVIEKDVDLESIEKAGIYRGRYFILGGLLSTLNAQSKSRARTERLFEYVKSSPHIREVILAMSTTVEGSFTARYVEKILEPLKKNRTLSVTHLAQGLSAGAELEYLNRDTLKSALENRR